jgi:hypothetical protein
MMVVPLTEADVRAIEPQAAQDLPVEARVALVMAQAQAGPCASIVDATGTVLLLGGVITDENWPGRAVGWTILSRHAGPHMRQLTRTVSDWLDGLGIARLEMYVDAQFPQGCRWARLLGFAQETPLPMRRFLPNGNGAYLFGRVR